MGTTVASESRFVGVAEAAVMLGMSYSAVWDALRRGDFPAPNVQIGNKWRISRAGLQRLIDGDAAVDIGGAS